MSYLGWLVVGAGLAVGVLGAFTIGVFVLPVALVLGAVLLWRRGLDVSTLGLIPGPGLVLLWVAWLNRDGPGDVCTHTATSSSCTQEWSPWPWLAAGLVVIIGGIALALGTQRAKRADRRSVTPAG